MEESLEVGIKGPGERESERERERERERGGEMVFILRALQH